MFSLSLPSIDTSRECPYTKSSFRNTSLWSLFKQNADFIVPSDDDEALNSVLAQNVELVNIFNHFKDSYVSFLKTLELKFERCFDPFISFRFMLHKKHYFDREKCKGRQLRYIFWIVSF